MNLDDLDLDAFGGKVRAMHGADVYEATVQRALAMAICNTSNDRFPDMHSGTERQTSSLTNDAVVAALRSEFLKLVRPH